MITFCIPSKNNLRYLKSSVESIRANSSNQHEIVVYIDADEDGTEEWLKANNVTYLKNESNEPKGIAYGYNRCIEAASNEIVCMFHADMYMAKGFDVNALKHLRPKTVVAATRIEPPLHPPGLEKIIQDFGMYPEDFKLSEFNSFVEQALIQYKDQVTYGIFAPWLCYKQELIDINLHDEYFHSYHEDSDIFNRMILSGMTCVQSRDSLVYHLTCRGGQFQDGIEQITTNPQFHSMKRTSQRHYLRKWGHWIKNNEYQHPIIPQKYNVAFVVHKCNMEILEALEPWCDRIYIDDEMGVLTTHYYDSEQSTTKYDLTKRVLCIGHNDPSGENDIVVEFDATKLTREDYVNIQTLSDILDASDLNSELNEPGEAFELGNLKLTIYNIQTYQKELILCK